MEERRPRVQSICFTYKAEDILKEYSQQNNVTFNKAVNEIVEGSKGEKDEVENNH